MRIAFAGASGTGKTTLAKWYSENYNVPLVPVGSRSVAADMGFRHKDGSGDPYAVDVADRSAYEQALNQGGTPSFAALVAKARWNKHGLSPSCRAMFQLRLQEEKIKYEVATQNFVSDRSTLDDLVYAAMHCREVLTEEYIQKARTHAASYDAIFYAPLAVFQHMDDDPARVVDPAYHLLFDATLFGVLRWSTNVVHLNSPSQQERERVVRDSGRSCWELT